MKKYHFPTHYKNYFEGWYFKHQNEDEAIAFILACHKKNHQYQYSLQIITPHLSKMIDLSNQVFQYDQEHFHIAFDRHFFSDTGILLDIDNVQANIKYSTMHPLKYPMMGPFSFVPFMQCRHDVLSTHHSIQGYVSIDDQIIDLNNGTGYIEKDWGYSFPSDYLWTQVVDLKKDISIMIAIATIPILNFSFTGCIAFIYFAGKEYRLATYLGVRILEWNEHRVILKQRTLKLSVDFIDSHPQPLLAPVKGTMSRTIHESLNCFVRYRFYDHNQLLFDFKSHQASYEYVEKCRKK